MGRAVDRADVHEPGDDVPGEQQREARQLIASLSGDHTIILSTHILPEVESVFGKAGRAETATDPVMIVTGRPEFKSTMIQTNPEVAETDIFEPMPLIAPYEPLTRAIGANADDDSQSEKST